MTNINGQLNAQFGGMSFTAGFGFFPSLFGLQFQVTLRPFLFLLLCPFLCPLMFPLFSTWSLTRRSDVYPFSSTPLSISPPASRPLLLRPPPSPRRGIVPGSAVEPTQELMRGSDISLSAFNSNYYRFCSPQNFAPPDPLTTNDGTRPLTAEEREQALLTRVLSLLFALVILGLIFF